MKIYNLDKNGNISETQKMHICYIGENAKENWKLLEKANDNDIFFHLSSFPSCYVILKYNEEIDEIVLYKVAQLCKNKTKYRNLKNLKIDYCSCSNLYKGEKVGQVYFHKKRQVKQIKL